MKVPNSKEAGFLFYFLFRIHMIWGNSEKMLLCFNAPIYKMKQILYKFTFHFYNSASQN